MPDRRRKRRQSAGALVVKSDPYIDPDLEEDGSMELRLTYAGELRSSRSEFSNSKRAHHVHKIRKCFHKQLKKLWSIHPGLVAAAPFAGPIMSEIFTCEGFKFRPMVTKRNGLICKLDILMLRDGKPGQVLSDIDNRLKTIFDALRMPDGPNELGSRTEIGQAMPENGEDPFYVLLQDDKLITHASVTTDTMLDPLDGVTPDLAVRLVLNVTIRPYHVTQDNLHFA